jgi:magnesium transporter
MSAEQAARPGGVWEAVVAAPTPRIKVILYDADGHAEHELANIDELDAFIATRPGVKQRGVAWIDVWGLEDAHIISTLGRMYNLHKLELEDIVNTHQRAKMEAYGDHLYIVVREAFFHDGLDTDQISIVMGKFPEGGGWLMTFQEKHGDCFDPVRERIRHRKGKLSSSGSDALAYALLDAVIDSYFPVLESYGERLEDIELETMDRPSQRIAHSIHDVKRDLLFMRRAVWPAREAVNSLIRDEHALITADTRIYLRDCYDHLIQLIDMLENYREIASGLMDIYLSSVSNRMNEIMKVLTIIATIFMPLSFIAGVYGMNFSTDADGPAGSRWNMPELHWRYGYFFALAVMGLTAAGMVYYFWRNGWIWGGKRADKRR